MSERRELAERVAVRSDVAGDDGRRDTGQPQRTNSEGGDGNGNQCQVRRRVGVGPSVRTAYHRDALEAGVEDAVRRKSISG